MTFRCMGSTYEATNGVTCMELVSRCVLVCCITFDRTFKHGEEEQPDNGDEEEEPEIPPPAPKQDNLGIQSYNPIQQHNNDNNFEAEGGMESEDKINLIGNAGNMIQAKTKENTRNNLGKNKFAAANTNGATESPSMEMDMQQLATGNLPNTPLQKRR